VIALASGSAMLVTFLGFLVAALIENRSTWFKFWTVVTAGEVAAWRVKWVALPVAALVIWGGIQIIRSIKRSPTRYIGLSAARAGFVAAVATTVLMAALIGITVPERLRQRQMAHNAAVFSQAHTYSRALLAYRELHGYIPGPDDLISELKTLPDPDGSIAQALQTLDVSGYQPGTVVAAATNKSKPMPLRGEVIRKTSVSIPVTDHGGMAFTNYDLRLPGEDKILNTEDDLIVRDGLVMTLSEYKAMIASRSRLRSSLAAWRPFI